MTIRLFLFFFLSISLYAENDFPGAPLLTSIETEPTGIIDGCVNVISGSYFDYDTDMTVIGPENLTVERILTNNNPNPYKGMNQDAPEWKFNLGGTISVFQDKSSKKTLCTYHGPLGEMLNYTYHYKHKPQGGLAPIQDSMLRHAQINTSRGMIGAQTNIRNNGLNFKSSNYLTELYKSNGDELFFHILPPPFDSSREHDTLIQYKELKTNYLKKTFEYNNKGDPIIIRLKNWEDKELSFIRREIKEPHTYVAPDGRYVRYQFEDYHIDPKSEFIKPSRKLTQVDRTEKPAVFYGYLAGNATVAKETQLYDTSERPAGIVRDYFLEWPHVAQKYLPNHRFLHIDYEKTNSRVKQLSAPLGSDITPIQKYKFVYYVTERNGGCTGVYDALGHLTNYLYNGQDRLTSIIKYHDNGEAYTAESLCWGALNTDKEIELQVRHFGLINSPFKTYAKVFHYDVVGNVIAEALHGNITGKQQGNTLVVDGSGSPVPNSADCLIKWNEYSADKYHLLTKTTTGIRTIRHQYIPGTSVLSATFSEENGKIYKRHFYFHDDNGMVIKQIIDDGSSEDFSDLTGVTERKIERVERTKEYPVGLPSVVTEFCLNLETQEEICILKKLNTHDNWGRLVNEETYGNDGTLAYARGLHYDLHSNILHEVTPEGHHISRTYDDNDNKITEVGPNPNITKHFAYDYMNRLISIHEHHPDGVLSKHFKYDFAGQLIAKIDAMGTETRTIYDSFYRPIATETNLTPPTRYEYDELSNPIKITTPEGSVTEFAYTIHKKPYKISYPDGTRERFEYDLEGRLIKEIDKNGTQCLYTYDVEGRIIKKQQLTADGEEVFSIYSTYNTFHLLSETDPEGNLTTYTYDYQGRKKTESKGDMITHFEYDRLNACCKTITTSLSHPEEGTVKSVVYDICKRPIIESTENLKGDVLTEVKTAYDVDGNKIKIEQDNSITTCTFDTHGIPVKTIDAEGNVTKTRMVRDYINDNGERVLRVEKTDPLGQTTVQIQDILGRNAKQIILNPFGEEIKKTAFTYNSNGKCIQTLETLPTREVINAWEYDYADRLICSIEAVGTPEEKRITNHYNLQGQLESTLKPDGVSIQFTYDEMGRLQEQTSSDQSIHYVYHYDISSHPIRVDNLIDQTSTLRVYDLHGRVIKETLGNGLAVSMDYTPEGGIRQITLPDHSSINYTYNGPQLTSVIRKDTSGNTRYTHSYDAYDQTGNLLKSSLIHNLGTITQVHTLKGQTASITSPHYSENLTYDAVGNLTARAFKDNKGAEADTYSHDELYQLTQESGSSNHTYTNDALYNRTSKDGKVHTHNSLNALISDGESTYTYDPCGNILTYTKADKAYTHTYDALDRLKTLTIAEATYNFTYDEYNRCLTINDERLLYVGQNDIGTANATTVHTLRVLGRTLGAEIGAAIAIEINDEVFAPLHDHRGNLIALIDSSGSPCETYRYSAFGEETTTGTLSPWRFSSKRKVGDYNLFGRRFYLPFLGRWLTPDPSGHEAGPNLYAYVSNSPLTRLDHYGLFEEECNMSSFDRLCSWGRSVVDRVCSYASRGYESARDGFDYVCRGVQSLGAGIEFVSHNFIVMPILKDIGCLLGYVMQHGTIEGYAPSWQTNRSCVDDLNRPNLYNKVRFVSINGMVTPLTEAKENATLFSDHFDGTNVIVAHNGTDGFLYDLVIESVLNKFGISTSAVRAAEIAIRRAIHEVGGPGQGGIVCVSDHSQGGIIADIVFSMLTKEERAMICSVTFGSARLIKPEGLMDCVNYVSKNDFIPATDMEFIGAKFFDTRPDVIFLDPIEGGFEHGFKCKTYQKALGEYAEWFKSEKLQK